MTTSIALPVIGHTPRPLSPTDISQFIRLEQCERYLRLRLHERTHGTRFLRDYDVTPQSIPPILTESGARFEQRVEAAVAGVFAARNLAAEMPAIHHQVNNDAVLEAMRALAPGVVLALFQVRLKVTIGEWLVRGDIDILRMERDADGSLRLLIADMKSSTSAKVEHRLQVAFYLEMLDALLANEGITYTSLDMGILYRGPTDQEAAATSTEQAKQEIERAAAERLFGVTDAYLEMVPDPESYRGSVRDLVTSPGSTAERIAGTPFDELFYHLTYKCDGCLYTEFCMKSAAEHDDLSLLPHLSPDEKVALQRGGVGAMRELATLKTLPPAGADGTRPSALVPTPGKEAVVRTLATTWPVGPRLDELIHRARYYRRRMKGDTIDALSYIPSKGYGSLPYCAPDHNPNLVRVYIDAQHDYLQDRIYLLGALVVGAEHGDTPPHRRRSIAHLTDGPPDTLATERDLFVRFTRDVIRAVVEVAAPDADGQPNAPVHLIFFNRFEQRLLLDGLSRHFTHIIQAVPLYDFVTQIAAFDSPMLTYLDQEMRELKNYPMVCQSLQAVASFLKFDWNTPEPYRDIFRVRLFDYWGKFDEAPGGREETRWFTSRARFNSQIPLEYAYAAWNALPPPKSGTRDEFASYRSATAPLLRGFHGRRLEAMEAVARDFRGNHQTLKTSFRLPDLADFESKAATLAEALDEFLTVERHTDLSAWKTARLAPPERRVLAGDTLIVAYHEEDQNPGVARTNREHQDRYAQRERSKADSAGEPLSKEQKKATTWSHAGARFRMRLACEGIDCGLDEALALSTLREGEVVVIKRRFAVDSRPGADPAPFTPTAKQLLYAMRGEIVSIIVERDAEGYATAATIELEMSGPRSFTDSRGFAFASHDEPLEPGARYTLDTDPNDWYGYFCTRVVDGLVRGECNALYDRLAAPAGIAAAAAPSRLPAAEAGQARFLQGLEAFHAAGLLHDFEPSKRDYIGGHGAAPLLLVQGPPGTGKSYSTAFAVFARLQGAMAAGQDYRVFLSCKTHAATDVLLENVAAVQRQLRALHAEHPDLFTLYLDPRLLDVPLLRLGGRTPLVDVVALRRKSERGPGDKDAAEIVQAAPWCVLGATPGGVYRMLLDRWNKLFAHQFCDLLVLDEASQMNLPEALMAALALRDDAPVVVVGDHRQMPPIVKHDWGSEPRRTFQEFRSYESLFAALLPLEPPLIQFTESFRLHADMAEFLRREVYAQDGIDFRSHRTATLPAHPHADPFVAAVLASEQTIVVIVHDEDESMQRNPFEEGIIVSLLDALAHAPYELDAEQGLGVVVPHRAQRAALQGDVPFLNVLDPVTGSITRSAVDTVERFQGDERTVILVGATESNTQYLLLSSAFLLDPRRLTVALSRAKQKLVLIAARSVFTLLVTDEELFGHSQLWKNLLRRTCTVPLWTGTRDGQALTVWGNNPAPADGSV